MALEGKVVYVAGSGSVAFGCVKEFLKAGAKVWITSRDWNRLDEIKLNLTPVESGRFNALVGSFASDVDCERIRDHILAIDKKIDHVVAALGVSWINGLLSNQTIEMFDNIMHDMIYSHFIIYRTFVKVLASQTSPSTYTFIVGGCNKDMSLSSSLLNMCDMCLYGMFKAASLEFNDHDFLVINQLRIFCKIKPVLDETLDQKREVLGCDLPGRMTVAMAEKSLKGILNLEDRKKCLHTISNIYNDNSDSS